MESDLPPSSSDSALDERIDAVLKRQFAPPPLPRLNLPVLDTAPVDTARAAPVARRRLVLGTNAWKLAAMVTISAGVLLYCAFTVRDMFSPRENLPSRALVTVYREVINAGFTPQWVCETDEEFASTIEYRHGRRLLMKPLPAGTTCVGMSYAMAMSPRSTLMLGQVGEHRVVVFIDRATYDRRDALPEASGLHLFKRAIGDLILYEASPLAEPVFLPLIFEPPPGPAAPAHSQSG